MVSAQSPEGEKSPVWLNVASSTYVEKGFINLDNHIFLQLSRFPKLATALLPREYHDYLESYRQAREKAVLLRHDCRKPLKMADNSADHILCSHFLEHVYPDEAQNILRDFRRVLKPGGTLHVIIPDLRLQVDEYLRNKEQGQPAAADQFVLETLLTAPNRGSAKFRIMELTGGFGLLHRWMYDKESITAQVAKAGFDVQDGLETPSAHVRHNDGCSVHVLARKV